MLENLLGSIYTYLPATVQPIDDRAFWGDVYAPTQSLPKVLQSSILSAAVLANYLNGNVKQ